VADIAKVGTRKDGWPKDNQEREDEGQGHTQNAAEKLLGETRRNESEGGQGGKMRS